ncbi:tail fiber protein [Curtobacterium flaccumfaciens]|nr:tail fiber protein [Curtobacterium flaccumfaciens]
MSEFFIGQIMLTGFAFAPKYFAQCNGQLLPVINQNQALFSLLSTRFGGDGRTTFGLPDVGAPRWAMDRRRIRTGSRLPLPWARRQARRR